MTIQNHAQTHLQPGILPFGCSTAFQGEPGKYSCSIHVKKGTVLFGHTSYNIEANGWSSHPDNNEAERILLHEGETRELEFTCQEHGGEPDCIWIANNSYLKPADFTCSYERQ